MDYQKQIDTLRGILKKVRGGNDVKVIFEIGARDGIETKTFAHFYPEALIYSFECNPTTVPLWRKNAGSIENVVLTEKAVSDKDGTISFFPTDPAKTITPLKDGNPGASSLLRASGKYEVEKYVQNEVKVSTTKLSTFIKEKNIEKVNLIWMDIQGAELMALKGLEDRIGDVEVIHTEVEFTEIYERQPLFGDINKYVAERGFLLCYFTSFGNYSADAVFVNKKLFVNRRFAFIYFRIKSILLYPAFSCLTSIKKIVRYILNFFPDLIKNKNK